MQAGNFQASFTTLCPWSALPESALEEADGKCSPWLPQVQARSVLSPRFSLFPPWAISTSAAAFWALQPHRVSPLARKDCAFTWERQPGNCWVGTWERSDAAQNRSCRALENNRNGTSTMVIDVCLSSKLPHPCSPRAVLCPAFTVTPIVTWSSFPTAQPLHTSSPKCPILLPHCHTPACLQAPSSLLSWSFSVKWKAASGQLAGRVFYQTRLGFAHVILVIGWCLALWHLFAQSSWYLVTISRARTWSSYSKQAGGLSGTRRTRK